MNWTKIRNEYINGHISYRKLAEKHDIPFSTLRDAALKGKWFEKRKEHRHKIDIKTEQKTVEKMSDRDSDIAVSIQSAAEKLLEKLTIAIEQTDMFIEKTKTKVPTKVQDKETGKLYDAYKETEEIRLSKRQGINVQSVKQLASALKDLRDIQLTAKDESEQEDTTVNIIFEAVTPEDIEAEGDE